MKKLYLILLLFGIMVSSVDLTFALQLSQKEQVYCHYSLDESRIIYGNTNLSRFFCSSSGRFLMQYVCINQNLANSGYYSQTYLVCNYGCEKGKCLPFRPNIYCRDSDGGLNYFVNGTIDYSTWINGFGMAYTTRDECLTENILKEWYCINLQLYFTNYTCSNGCFEGRCL